MWLTTFPRGWDKIGCMPQEAHMRDIDQLIQDLAQQRAKTYHEKALRFKAQQEQQRKAAEAHEKKQLEYMRSAGVKVNEIEQDLKEDSRKLKSYLEQTRPSLISRPAMNVTDAKNA